MSRKSADQEAKAKFGSVETGEIAVALGPLAESKISCEAAHDPFFGNRPDRGPDRDPAPYPLVQVLLRPATRCRQSPGARLGPIRTLRLGSPDRLAGTADSVQAIMVTESGGPEVLQAGETAIPEPGPEEILVRVLAAGVGPWDASLRQGRIGGPLPYVPG